MQARTAGSLALTLASGLAAGAHGPETGPYLGVGLGATDLDSSRAEVDAAASAAGLTGSTTQFDDTDTGWKIFGGYRFNPYVAAELTYVDVGEASATYVATAPTAATLAASADGTAVSAAVVGIYPLGERVEIFGKIGLYRWDVDGTATAVVGGASVSASDSDDGIDVMFGAGVGYNFTDNIGVRIEWERYNDLSDADVDMFSVGAVYGF